MSTDQNDFMWQTAKQLQEESRIKNVGMNDIKQVGWNVFKMKNGDLTDVGYKQCDEQNVLWIPWKNISTRGRGAIKCQQQSIGNDWEKLLKYGFDGQWTNTSIRNQYPYFAASEYDDVSSMNSTVSGSVRSMNKSAQITIGQYFATTTSTNYTLNGKKIIIPQQILGVVDCDVQQAQWYGRLCKPFEKVKMFGISHSNVTFNQDDVDRAAKNAFKRLGHDIGVNFPFSRLNAHSQKAVKDYWNIHHPPLSTRPNKRTRNMQQQTHNNNGGSGYGSRLRNRQYFVPRTSNISRIQTHRSRNYMNTTNAFLNSQQLNNNNASPNYSGHNQLQSTPIINNSNSALNSEINNDDLASIISTSTQSSVTTNANMNNNNALSMNQSRQLIIRNLSNLNPLLNIPTNVSSNNETNNNSSTVVSQLSQNQNQNENQNRTNINTRTNQTQQIQINTNNNNNTSTQTTQPNQTQQIQINTNNNNNTSTQTTQPINFTNTESNSQSNIQTNINNNNTLSTNQSPAQRIEINANNNTPNTQTNISQITNDAKDTMFGRWYDNRRAPAMQACVQANIYQYEENFRYPHYKTIVNSLVVSDPDKFKWLTVNNLKKQFVSNVALVARKIKSDKTDDLKNKSQKDMIPYVKGLNLSRHMIRSRGNEMQTLTAENRQRCEEENMNMALQFIQAKKNKESAIQIEKRLRAYVMRKKVDYYESSITRNQQWANAATVQVVDKVSKK
eukprot:200153_1